MLFAVFYTFVALLYRVSQHLFAWLIVLCALVL